MQKNLTIANFTIALRSAFRILVDVGYRHFVCGESDVSPEIRVECMSFDDMPADLFEGAELVFSSENSEKRFYTISRKKNELLFELFDQENNERVQQIARLDESLKNWEIWSVERAGEVEPLKFPMGSIMLHYIVLQADAVMMHASGVFDGAKGRMFSGFSGAGKSTIARIWARNGSKVVNDDRLIIRKENYGYFMYNTPMYYEDIPKRKPLDAVYLIRHSAENTLTRISGAEAVASVMAFSIQNNYDGKFVEHHAEFFEKLCRVIPVFKLGVVPDDEIVRFVKG